MNKPSRFLCSLVLLTSFLLSACASLSSPPHMPLATGLQGLVEGRIDIGGYELYYQCIGDGSPTVILEAGSEGDSSSWELVMLYYQKHSRICAYDRANLGQSGKAKKPRTYADMTRDLHALLQNTPVKGPYVLVGYSMGGMLVRLYTGLYPEQVVGVVLVDSAHPNMGLRLLETLPNKMAGEDPVYTDWREYAEWMTYSTGEGKFDTEDVDNVTSLEQVRAVTSFGDIPLAVVSRNPENTNMVAFLQPLPEELNSHIMQLWQDLQTELQGLSSNNTRYTAERSDHGVPFYEPRLVVDAIRQVVDAYRVNTGITVPQPPDPTEVARHTPVITGISERQEWIQGMLYISKDISFSDSAGDAITIVNTPLKGSNTIIDDIIRVPSDEQKIGATVTSPVRCRRAFEAVIEYRVYDAAGNLSNPEIATFTCPAPRFYLNLFLTATIVMGLLLVAWLTYHRLGRRKITL